MRADPTHDEGAPGERGPSNVNNGDVLRIPDLDHFARRLIVDAVRDVSRQWWLKRAEDFERAKPRAEDFAGSASIEDLRARWRWCHATAQACRNKAALVPLDAATFHAEMCHVLDEEAAA